jgi:hypothetical protein
VLLILALVGMLYVDGTALPAAWKSVARLGLAAAPILMPAGFFFSIIPRQAERPGPAINLVYLGAAALAVGTVTLGVGLVR